MNQRVGTEEKSVCCLLAMPVAHTLSVRRKYVHLIRGGSRQNHDIRLCERCECLDPPLHLMVYIYQDVCELKGQEAHFMFTMFI